jgi:hypothetical protein
LRENGDELVRSEETFLAGLPQSLESPFHESEVDHNRVDVYKEAQLFRITHPVAIQRLVLILFRIVEAINPESHEGGEMRKFCGISLPGLELSPWLIPSSELMNEQLSRVEKVCLKVLREGYAFWTSFALSEA